MTLTFGKLKSAKKLCLYLDSNVFCNPHYYLTPSARLPGNPEKLYDGLLGLEGLILVGDMTADGALRGHGRCSFMATWHRRRRFDPSASSIVHTPACACLSISQSLSIGDAIKRGLLARQINSLLAVADSLKLLPS